MPLLCAEISALTTLTTGACVRVSSLNLSNVVCLSLILFVCACVCLCVRVCVFVRACVCHMFLPLFATVDPSPVPTENPLATYGYFFIIPAGLVLAVLVTIVVFCIKKLYERSKGGITYVTDISKNVVEGRLLTRYVCVCASVHSCVCFTIIVPLQ